MSTKGTDAKTFLEGLVGPLTFGKMLASIREGDELSQSAFARQLGISRQNLCDIEKGRKSVSPSRAAKWAKKLGYSASVFVGLALQALVEAEGLQMDVSVVARKKPRGHRAA